MICKAELEALAKKYAVQAKAVLDDLVSYARMMGMVRGRKYESEKDGVPLPGLKTALVEATGIWR